MKIPLILSGLCFALLLGACGMHHMAHDEAEGIRGETVTEVAAALNRMKGQLAPKKAEEFGHALDTLTRVVPDKYDSRTVGEMSPQFVSMVRGRNADQIIQLAVLYRVNAPPDRRK